MQIKSLALAGLVAASAAFAGTPEAAASESWRCGRLAGYHVCAIDRSQLDSIKIEWTNGDFTWMRVWCDAGRWEITEGAQYISRYNATQVATRWCFG